MLILTEITLRKLLIPLIHEGVPNAKARRCASREKLGKGDGMARLKSCRDTYSETQVKGRGQECPRYTKADPSLRS